MAKNAPNELEFGPNLYFNEFYQNPESIKYRKIALFYQTFTYVWVYKSRTVDFSI